MSWEVILTNGETIKDNESDVSSWRKLKEKCLQENLKILEFKYDGQIIDPDAHEYFVYYDMVAIMRGPVLCKRGVGSIKYTDGEKPYCRIRWFRIQGAMPVCNEVLKEVPEIAQEVSIKHEMPTTPKL